MQKPAILDLLARRATGKTICPSDAARVLGGDEGFRPVRLPNVRSGYQPGNQSKGRSPFMLTILLIVVLVLLLVGGFGFSRRGRGV